MAVLFVARVSLGLVFVAAACGKVLRPAGIRDTLREFGLPPRAVSPAARGLPLAEMVCAALLLAEPVARIGAAAAIVLLAVFSAAVARAIARGQQLECNCFGALHSAPITGVTLARNLALIAVAVLLLVAGPGHAPSVSLSGTDVLIVSVAAALLMLIALHAFFSVQLFRQNGRLLERIEALEAQRTQVSPAVEGLPAGTAAPRFELEDVSGERRSLDDLLSRGVPLALAFLDPDCGACGPVMTQLAAIGEQRRDDLTVALVTRGEVVAARRRVNGYRFDAVLVQDGSEVAEAFRVARVPSAQLVQPDGTIAGPLAVGGEAIGRLLGGPAQLDVVLVNRGG